MKAGRKSTAKNIGEYFASGSGRKLWKEGQVKFEEGGTGIPEYDDGKYKAKVVKAWAEQSQTSSRWQNVIEFKFLDGEYKGKSVRQYQGVDTDWGVSILLQTLSKLGLEIESPEDIESADKKLTKKQPVVEIRLRTKGEFQNVIVSAPLEGEDADEDEDSEDEDEEDEDDDTDVDADEDEEEEKPAKKKKKSKSDDEDEDEDEEEAEKDEDDEDSEDEDSDDEDADEEDDEEPKPKKKKKKDVEAEEDEDEPEEDEDDEEEEDEEEDEEQVALKIGMKLKVKYDGEEVNGKIVKVMEKKKQVKVKLKDGSKVVIGVPDDIVDVLE